MQQLRCACIQQHLPNPCRRGKQLQPQLWHRRRPTCVGTVNASLAWGSMEDQFAGAAGLGEEGSAAIRRRKGGSTSSSSVCSAVRLMRAPSRRSTLPLHPGHGPSPALAGYVSRQAGMVQQVGDAAVQETLHTIVFPMQPGRQGRQRRDGLVGTGDGESWQRVVKVKHCLHVQVRVQEHCSCCQLIERPQPPPLMQLQACMHVALLHLMLSRPCSTSSHELCTLSISPRTNSS